MRTYQCLFYFCLWLHGFLGFCFPNKCFLLSLLRKYFILEKFDDNISTRSAHFYKMWHFCDIQIKVILTIKTSAVENYGCLLLPALWRPCVLFLEDQLPPGFPTIDMGPQLKVVERSRTATMLCAASGNPDPEITWFKDFLPVNTSSNNARIKQLRSGNRPLLPLFCLQCTVLPFPSATLLLAPFCVNYLYNSFCFLFSLTPFFLDGCSALFPPWLLSAPAVIWVARAAFSKL